MVTSSAAARCQHKAGSRGSRHGRQTPYLTPHSLPDLMDSSCLTTWWLGVWEGGSGVPVRIVVGSFAVAVQFRYDSGRRWRSNLPPVWTVCGVKSYGTGTVSRAHWQVHAPRRSRVGVGAAVCNGARTRGTAPRTEVSRSG